ncbi:MAG: monofunctional biosynthetic peptidoglycan transglycosylase [Acidobacteria bacterium]|nr:monofunctional biosynthetic peptidoglycan transglycosylase [Acidobacteriota bacterium]
MTGNDATTSGLASAPAPPAESASPPPRRRGLTRRIATILFLLVAAFVLYEWVTFPDVAGLRKKNPTTTAFMEQRRARLRSERKGDALKQRWVAYDRISPNLRRAVIVSEDSSFYEHEGVDIDELKKSFETNLEKGKLARGGSTITQQLAKNLYLSPSKNPWRKVKELLITRALERELSKKRILEIYLNVVEFGERVYGAEAASRHYFNKPAAALAPQEAALLAGCLPSPRTMNPGAPNRRLRARQRIILSRMNRWGRYFEQQVLTAPPPPNAVEEVGEEEGAGEPSDETLPEETETAETDASATDATATDATAIPPTETGPVATPEEAAPKPVDEPPLEPPPPGGV